MTLLGDILRQIRQPGEQTGYFAVTQGGDRQGFFTDQPDLQLPQDRNVWFSLNPGTTGYRTLPDGRVVPTQRVTRATVTRLAALHADLDIGGAGKTIPNLQAAQSIVTDLSTMLGTPPIAIIGSGHGYQPIWAIQVRDGIAGDEAGELLKRWGSLVKMAAQMYGGEVDSVFELARLVRAPGSINYKHTPVAATATMLAGRPLSLAEIRTALDAYSPAPERPAVAASAPYTGPAPAEATLYERNAVNAEIERLRELPRPWHSGAAWDSTIFAVATSLTEIANSPWSVLTHQDVEYIIDTYAPYDDAWDERRAKLDSARRTAAGKRRPAPNVMTRTDDSEMFRGMDAPSSGSRVIAADRTVDVSSTALAAKWLVETAGTGGLSGMFFRKGEIVHTPAIGEEGFVELKNTVAEASASITPLTTPEVRARITVTHNVIKQALDEKATKAAQKENEDAPAIYKPKPAIFPLDAADVLVKAPDLAPHLRALHGVVHTPSFRPDGTIISKPGYDEATGLLYLPTGQQPDYVPDTPSLSDVEIAVKRLDYLIQDFAFVTAHDRASYLGLMLTPLLRTMLPPPYKLGVIEAHQPGSGKSYLARALMSIHGGVEQSGLAPNDEELSKAVGAILDTQTAPVVVFDNVDGIVRSPLLAGLLTSPTFNMRRLGSSTRIEATNDRLWVMTANNATLSGDLGRRNIRVRIDPGIPNPELRTDVFAIDDFEGFVRERRGELLWSLLVLIRHWVTSGSPVAPATQDSYGRWISVLRGVLKTAGIPGNVDDESTKADAHDPEADEFESLLRAIYGRFGEHPWTAKEMLAQVCHPTMKADPTRPIPFEDLPDWLIDKHRVGDPVSLARKLGTGLRFRQGRFYGRAKVVQAGQDRTKVARWRIEVS